MSLIYVFKIHLATLLSMESNMSGNTLQSSSMYGLPVHVPCTKCSFYHVMETMNPYLKMPMIPVLFSPQKVNITDTLFFFKTFQHHYLDDMLVWADTCSSPVVMPVIEQDVRWRIVATSKWNAQLVKMSTRIDPPIVPRPVNEDVVARHLNDPKTRLFVTLGDSVSIPRYMLIGNRKVEVEVTFYNDDQFVDNGHVVLKRSEKHDPSHDRYVIKTDKAVIYDRKGLIDAHEITKEMGLRDKTLVMGNIQMFSDVATHSMDEDTKYKNLASAKWYLAFSQVEGFGVPPVEAMAVGTPPIYIDAHGYHDWLVGIPVKAEEHMDVKVGTNMIHVWRTSKERLKEGIATALSMSDEEYEDLRAKAIERGKRFYARRVIQELNDEHLKLK